MSCRTDLSEFCLVLTHLGGDLCVIYDILSEYDEGTALSKIRVLQINLTSE